MGTFWLFLQVEIIYGFFNLSIAAYNVVIFLVVFLYDTCFNKFTFYSFLSYCFSFIHHLLTLQYRRDYYYSCFLLICPYLLVSSWIMHQKFLRCACCARQAPFFRSWFSFQSTTKSWYIEDQIFSRSSLWNIPTPFCFLYSQD